MIIILLCGSLICLGSRCPCELCCNLSVGRYFQLICALSARALSAVIDLNGPDQPHMGPSPTASDWRLPFCAAPSLPATLAVGMSISRSVVAMPDCGPCWPRPWPAGWLPSLTSELCHHTPVWQSGLRADPSCRACACPARLGTLGPWLGWWGPCPATCVIALNVWHPSFREQLVLAAPWLSLLKSKSLPVVIGEAVESPSLEMVKTWLHTELAPCSSSSCFQQKGGCDDFQGSLPTSAILWFVFASTPRLPILTRGGNNWFCLHSAYSRWSHPLCLWNSFTEAH